MTPLQQVLDNVARLKTLLTSETASLQRGDFDDIEKIWLEKQRLTSEFERMVHNYKNGTGLFQNLSKEQRETIKSSFESLEKSLKRNMQFLGYVIDIKKFMIEGLTAHARNAEEPLNNYTPEGSSQGTKWGAPSVSLNENL
ncbi:hypothetical protein OAN22_02605 [Alphaproteobacteria bacterium]|nr:hypothetical protein [Alphaproteobacteria bacterium]